MQALMLEFLAYPSTLADFCQCKGMCEQLAAGFSSYLRGQGVI